MRALMAGVAEKEEQWRALRESQARMAAHTESTERAMHEREAQLRAGLEAAEQRLADAQGREHARLLQLLLDRLEQLLLLGRRGRVAAARFTSARVPPCACRHTARGVDGSARGPDTFEGGAGQAAERSGG